MRYLLYGVLGLVGVLGTAWAGPKQPNIIFILADDMGYGDVSKFGGKAPTPAIDRLAEEGMRFTDAHTTSAVCTPTRYGILTGRYNWRSRLKKGVLWGESEPLIPEERLTVARLLRERGYETSVVGKWHLGLGWSKFDEAATAESGPTKGPCWNIDYSKAVKGGPLALGFSEDFLFPASLDMPPYVYLRNDKVITVPTVTKAFKEPNRPGPAAADFEAVNVLSDFARESRAFIRRSAEAKKPFFLYLPLTSPHTPIVPAERWVGKSGLGEYGDFLMETDWVVGEVLAELDELKLTEDTLIVFTADNGCSPRANLEDLASKGHKANGELRGHKADIYEGGHRVPFVVRWPSSVTAGQTTGMMVCTTDFMATVAEVLGADLPANAAEDSFSFLDVLQGNGGTKRQATVHHSVNGSFAFRQGDWKLVLCPGSGGWSAPRPGKTKGLYPVQLFNLKDDLAETTNLAEHEKDRVVAMAESLAAIIRQGRSNAGPAQSNEGWPATFPKPVLELLPQLRE